MNAAGSLISFDWYACFVVPKWTGTGALLCSVTRFATQKICESACIACHAAVKTSCIMCRAGAEQHRAALPHAAAAAPTHRHTRSLAPRTPPNHIIANRANIFIILNCLSCSLQNSIKQWVIIFYDESRQWRGSSGHLIIYRLLLCALLYVKQ